MLRSLDEAHARGIIHRDLKPDNIFLARVHGRPDDDVIVKVVDFGIAKIRDGELAPGLDPVATQEGTVFGTPRYMSPEQAQGKSLDGRSDLYAVGVLLFHMLTGQAPFTDDDAVIVMAHHIKTVPPRVREMAPGPNIPASLELLVARALDKSPDERPQTAQLFLSELEALAPEIEAARARSILAAEARRPVVDAAPLRRAVDRRRPRRRRGARRVIVGSLAAADPSLARDRERSAEHTGHAVDARRAAPQRAPIAASDDRRGDIENGLARGAAVDPVRGAAPERLATRDRPARPPATSSTTRHARWPRRRPRAAPAAPHDGAAEAALQRAAVPDLRRDVRRRRGRDDVGRVRRGAR